MANKDGKKGEIKKFQPKDPAVVRAGKLKWCREAAAAVRKNAYQFDMTESELRGLAEGMVNGSADDGLPTGWKGEPDSGKSVDETVVRLEKMLADQDADELTALKARLAKMEGGKS